VSGSDYRSTIPREVVVPGSVEYYLDAADRAGNLMTNPAQGADAPHVISVSSATRSGGGGLDWFLAVVLIAVLISLALALTGLRRRGRGEVAKEGTKGMDTTVQSESTKSAQVPPETGASLVPPSFSMDDPANRLQKLEALKTEGLLTREEYEKKRREILDRL